MKPLTNEDELVFRRYWKSLKKDVLIDKLWEMIQFMEYQQEENENLKQQVSRSNAQYLSSCRSVGGITLPPGV